MNFLPKQARTEDARQEIGVWAAWLIGALLILALIPPFMRFAVTSANWLPYPYPRAGSEGLILYESLMVRRGDDIYAPITPERFISGPYPPIYYWLAAQTLPDTAPDFSSPATVSSLFTPGRAISLIVALLAAALIPLLVLFDGSYIGRGKRAVWLAILFGVAGGITFLTLPQTVVWATRFRGDMLMLAFTAAGLACIAVGSGREAETQSPSSANSLLGTRYSVLATRYSVLVLGAVFFALAFYTKQTAIAGPIAAGAYLVLRDWRLGLKWGAAMLLAVGVPFIALEVATGHWFYLKMVDYHSLPLRASTLTRLLEFAWWEDSWPLILTALGYALYHFVMWIRRRRAMPLHDPQLIPIFFIASLLTLPTGAVIGADHNHLLMSGLAIAASVGAAGALLSTEYRVPTTEYKRLITRYSLLGTSYSALVVVYALITSLPSAWYEPDLVVPTPAVQEQYRLIVQNVRANPGELFFSDDPGIVALAGKRTPYDDPFTMTALALGGRWDESRFREMLRGGRFNLLVLACNVIEAPQTCRADTLSPGAIEAIRDGYSLRFRDVLFTYAPRQ